MKVMDVEARTVPSAEDALVEQTAYALQSDAEEAVIAATVVLTFHVNLKTHVGQWLFQASVDPGLTKPTMAAIFREAGTVCQRRAELEEQRLTKGRQ